MSASNEYTIWHLTVNGWVPGDTKLDFGKYFESPRPESTVASCRYYEYIKEMNGPLETGVEIIYIKEGVTARQILRAICRFGECPKTLNIHRT